MKALLARHNDGILRLIGLSDKRDRIRVGEAMREEKPVMMQPLTNKLKADAVREYGEHLRMMAIMRTVPNTPEQYANKLESGDEQ